MNDPFLKKVSVNNPIDAMGNSLRAAVQRNKTYVSGTPDAERKKFRRTWDTLIVLAAKKYSQPVTDADHCDTISQIAQSLSRRFELILIGGRLRFGTSQKALNLYLKFMWRLGYLPKPPHCPIDGVVLRAAGLSGSWTKSDCAGEYLDWVNALRELVQQSTVADWEYLQWNRKASSK